jgi:hypothetical protein
MTFRQPVRQRALEGERESRFGDHVDAFVGEFEVADDLVLEVFGSCAAVEDVVGIHRQ